MFAIAMVPFVAGGLPAQFGNGGAELGVVAIDLLHHCAHRRMPRRALGTPTG
jgi:hypothetical protein